MDYYNRKRITSLYMELILMYIEDIRSALEVSLSEHVSDELWSLLVELGSVEDVEIEARDINYLADMARKILEAGSSRRVGVRAPTTVPGEDEDRDFTWDTRAEVASSMFAMRATGSPAVDQFRRKRLGDAFPQMDDQVEEWIKSQAERDGDPTLWLTIPARPDPDGNIFIRRPVGSESDEDLPADLRFTRAGTVLDYERIELRYLEYSVPSFLLRQIQPVAAGGVLEELLLLSERLASDYPWTSAQATMFVLTARIPMVLPVEAEVDFKEKVRAATRITMVIDPEAEPKSVARDYQILRQQLKTEKRWRHMSEKHLRLAEFSYMTGKPESWDDRMKEWNKTYPQWRYSQRSNFTRDALRDELRVLQPPYKNIGGPLGTYFL